MLKPLDELGKKEVRAYIRHLQSTRKWPKRQYMGKGKDNLSPYTVQGHIRAIKAFWGWLANEGCIDENPLAKFPLPKVPQNLVKTITIEQFESLLAHVSRDSADGIKYRCILLLLFGSGLRISEAVKIRLGDIDFISNFIKVTGKGQKERFVPIHDIIRKEIKRYLYNFRTKLCPEDSSYLFANFDGQPISISSVQQFLRRLAQRAEFNEIKVSPHILRHTFATIALANGADVFSLKEIMGHASLQTTLKYTHIKPADLKRKYLKFSPLSNLSARKTTR